MLRKMMMGMAGGDPTVNAGRRVIVFIGDSNVVGQGEAAGPTPTLGTVKEFDGTNIVNVTNVDITQGLTASQAANIGSMMPKFGIDYYTRTGVIPVLTSCGRGASCFAANGGDGGNNFSSTGNNRGFSQTKIAAALAANGSSRVGEIIVNLGINDFSTGNTFATISTAIDDFHTWLTTTYPSVRITYLQVGRSAASIVSTKQSQIRNKIRSLAEANSGVHLINAPVAMYDYGHYKVDLIHFNQTGLNFLGAAVDDYFESIDAGYNKFAAGVFCSFKDAVNTTKKNAINVFVSKYYNTNLALMETFQISKGDTEANTFLDWVGLLAPLHTSITFVANSEIQTSGGTGSFIDHQWMLDEQLIRCTDQDINIACKVGSKTTADGVTACLYGAVGSVDNTSISLFQTTTPSIQWRIVEDGGTSTILTTAPDTKVIANSLYEMVRTGANTCALYRDGVKIQDGTTAYEGTLNRTVKSGGRGNAAATVSSPIAAGFTVFYVAIESGFDRTDWDTDLDTLIAAL